MDDDTMYGVLDADQLWELYATADLIRSRISADLRFSYSDLIAMNSVCQYLKEAAQVEAREAARREVSADEGFSDYIRRTA